MKGYRDYMNARTVDEILHEKIMRGITGKTKPIPSARYLTAAACAAVFLLGLWLIPGFFGTPNAPNDPNGFIANLPIGEENGEQHAEQNDNGATVEPQAPELKFTTYALIFNDAENGAVASRIVSPDFAHGLTDEQFHAIFPFETIFPAPDGRIFYARVSYWLNFDIVEVFASMGREDGGQATITMQERNIAKTSPLPSPESWHISYVHGVEVIASVHAWGASAEFMLGGIGYFVNYSYPPCRETAKERLTELVNKIIYGGAADWSVLADPIVPELRNEKMLLEQARLDPDFGAFMPVNVPQGFVFDSGRRTLNQWDNSVRMNWHRYPTFDNIHWAVAEAREFEFERIVSASDRHKFDVSLYSIPWMDSVPSEIREYLRDPVFLAEEMTLEIVQARAYWHEGGYGESAGWRIVSFGVLYGDVIVRVSARGVSAEQLWAMLP